MDIRISFVKQTLIINTFVARHHKKIVVAKYDKPGCFRHYDLVISNAQESYLDDWYMVLFDAHLEPQHRISENYRKKILGNVSKHEVTLLKVDEHYYIHCDSTNSEFMDIEDYIILEAELDSKKRKNSRQKAAKNRASNSA